MALARVSYRVGRERAGQYDESFAGAQFPKASVSVSPYATDGRLLPLMTAGGEEAPQGDHRIMAYSFRLCLTELPSIRVLITRPDNYDATQFELFRRYYAKHPDAEFPIDLYPIPGGKLDGNNGISKQLSLGLVGSSWEWPDATPQRRKELLQQHRTYTHGLLWFLANDSAVPATLGTAPSRLGWQRMNFSMTTIGRQCFTSARAAECPGSKY